MKGIRTLKNAAIFLGVAELQQADLGGFRPEVQGYLARLFPVLYEGYDFSFNEAAYLSTPLVVGFVVKRPGQSQIIEVYCHGVYAR